MSRIGLGDFVVDIVSGELWSAGAEGGRERIVLREQPLRVLRLLIEKVAYDGKSKELAIIFRPTGIATLAVEVGADAATR